MKIRDHHIYTAEDLASEKCDPDCKHDDSLVCLRLNCHPGGGVRIGYNKATGVLYAHCAKCAMGGLLVRVAHREREEASGPDPESSPGESAPLVQ
jgi:hypothetical protein